MNISILIYGDRHLKVTRVESIDHAMELIRDQMICRGTPIIVNGDTYAIASNKAIDKYGVSNVIIYKY